MTAARTVQSTTITHAPGLLLRKLIRAPISAAMGFSILKAHIQKHAMTLIRSEEMDARLLAQ